MRKVSVIVPVFNRAGLVAGTLERVVRQTSQPYEIIVCDDGSTDGTPNICRDYLRNFSIPHNVVSIGNSGPSFARKTAVSHSEGDWLFFLDSDDLWDLDYLESMGNLIERFQPGAVVSDFRVFDRSENRISSESKFRSAPPGFWEEGFDRFENVSMAQKPRLFEKAFRFQPCFPSGMACSRECYENVGGITLTSRTLKSEDAHFVRRVFFFCTVAFSHETKLTIVLHDDNRSQQHGNPQVDFTRKLHGRLEILKMMMEEKEIAAVFSRDLKTEIEDSARNLFDHYCWSGQHDRAIQLFPELAPRHRTPKTWFNYCLAGVKSGRPFGKNRGAR
jgi:hypothetical protein